MAGGRRGDLPGDAPQSFLDQLFQAPAGAVAGEHAQIVDMHGGAFVGVGHFLVINFIQPVVGGNGSAVGQDQAPYRIGDGGIFLYPPVVDMEVVVHQILVVQQGGIHVPDLLPLFPVQDIGLCHIGIAGIGQYLFHTVLDAFHADQIVFDLGIEVGSDLQSQHVDDAGMVVFMKCFECFGNGTADLGHVKINDLAIAFYH